MAYEPDLQGTARSNVFTEHLYKIRITFGSSSISSYRAKDVTLVRNSAGNYTVTLPKTYEELTDFNGSFVDASGAVLFWVVTSQTLQTDGKLILEVRTEAGTATDPTAADVGLVTIGVSSDILNTKFTG